MVNHQSAFDIFAVLGFLPLHFKWIARKEIFRIPILGWAMRAAGYISIDREGKTRLTRRELLPFPEGEEGERARERIAQAREAGGTPSRGGRGGGPRGRDRDRDGGGRGGGRPFRRRNG